MKFQNTGSELKLYIIEQINGQKLQRAKTPTTLNLIVQNLFR